MQESGQYSTLAPYYSQCHFKLAPLTKLDLDLIKGSLDQLTY